MCLRVGARAFASVLRVMVWWQSRHKKTAQERGGQRLRAEARMACWLLRGLEPVHRVALRAALADLDPAQREAADRAAAEQAAPVQAEMTAEMDFQRVEVERLAADAAPCGAVHRIAP